ncbi:hypothetical protein B0H66DRAFT_531198 [Apodospora peruviana]|uniref:Uncharacterized protein n=1 Tax=Apodospora peruviana TaxID=516989 RepID=A0AAE0IB27_9PEZI|nr:hypothetical protein B0H66DRAFT_531198 [Apodospora peruviana]
MLKQRQSLRHSVRVVLVRRFLSAGVSGDDDEDATTNIRLERGVLGGIDHDYGRDSNPNISNVLLTKASILFTGLDLWARLLNGALVVFVYAKIHSWVGLEVFVFVAYGVIWTRNTRELMAMLTGADDCATTVLRPHPLPAVVRRFNRFLFAAQAITYVTMGIWIVAISTLSGSPPHNTRQPPNTARRFIFLDRYCKRIQISGELGLHSRRVSALAEVALGEKLERRGSYGSAGILFEILGFYGDEQGSMGGESWVKARTEMGAM